ncbi:hypothetical protein BHAOGJBA_0429 [Methylobacterium hispanicum]|jgi:hypothetical protein|uniref:Uncharacterized protein n=1 Tax=Methylobacterium hispanicum TaxID=270350 RepID=A0AAV4ZET7_9HYPH|nr:MULTISPECIES: hypothetical protein [Methylobacterium]GJD86931.1 hypothetical protein BHAOGJBA_0429 [Methylobacterium hispanicum]
MYHVSRCLRKLEGLSAAPDSTVADQVDAALNELEQAYRQPSEGIVALEAVLQEVWRNRKMRGPPIGHFIQASVERRQEVLARHA